MNAEDYLRENIRKNPSDPMNFKTSKYLNRRKYYEIYGKTNNKTSGKRT